MLLLLLYWKNRTIPKKNWNAGVMLLTPHGLVVNWKDFMSLMSGILS